MNRFLLHDFTWLDEPSGITFHTNYFLISPNFNVETWVMFLGFSATHDYSDDVTSLKAGEFPLENAIEYIANEHLRGIAIYL